MGTGNFIQRTFTVDGREVACRFFSPVASEVDFECRYEIVWPEGVRSRTIFGVDEVQALLLAMQSAHTDLLISRANGGREVAWLDQSSLGLPLAKSLRDLDPEGAL